MTYFRSQWNSFKDKYSLKLVRNRLQRLIWTKIWYDYNIISGGYMIQRRFPILCILLISRKKLHHYLYLRPCWKCSNTILDGTLMNWWFMHYPYSFIFHQMLQHIPWVYASRLNVCREEQKRQHSNVETVIDIEIKRLRL